MIGPTRCDGFAGLANRDQPLDVRVAGCRERHGGRAVPARSLSAVKTPPATGIKLAGWARIMTPKPRPPAARNSLRGALIADIARRRCVLSGDDVVDLRSGG